MIIFTTLVRIKAFLFTFCEEAFNAPGAVHRFSFMTVLCRYLN